LVNWLNGWLIGLLLIAYNWLVDLMVG